MFLFSKVQRHRKETIVFYDLKKKLSAKILKYEKCSDGAHYYFSGNYLAFDTNYLKKLKSIISGYLESSYKNAHEEHGML